MSAANDSMPIADGLEGLDRFGADLAACLHDALGDAGQFLQDQIAALTPVASGALRASLACGPVELSGDDKAPFLTVLVGSPLVYAPVVEFGRADGRPPSLHMGGRHMASTALQQSGPAIASLLQAATVRALHGIAAGAG